MHERPLTRIFLRCFLGFLVVSALIAIATVLHGEPGATSVRILGTSLSISAGSICAMACAAFRERIAIRPFGEVGIALATLATLLLVILTWGDWRTEFFPKVVGIVGITAVSFAHAELLWLPSLRAGARSVQVASSVTIAALCVLLAVQICIESDSEALFRTLAVLAILVALQTLLIPILWKLQAAASQVRDRLVLMRRPDGSYVDGAGTVYAVQPIAPSQADSGK